MCVGIIKRPHMEKICTKCNLSYPIEVFHKNKSMKDGRHSQCPKCKYEYDKEYRQRKEYKDKEYLRSAERRLYDWRIRFRGAYWNAVKRGYEWTITIEDVPIPKICPLLGIPLVMGDKYRWNKPSIDRIDSSKGYTKDNVWVISVLANTMKSIATKEQLISFAENTLKIFKN